MPQRIVFTGKQQVVCESFDPKALEPDQVRIQARCSLMSTGTENIVFNRLFDTDTNWAKWAKDYPFYPGYALVGVVEAVGPAVQTLRVGDRVAVRQGHATVAVERESECFPIPDAVSDEDASWFALAKITGMGLAAAELSVGSSVAVVGAGPVGQMMMRWAVLAGADPVVAIDPVAHRLTLAERGGVTHTLAQGVGEVAEALTAIGGGQLPQVVVDSTGHHAVFPLALGLCRKFGRLVLLGDTGTPTKQHLIHDVVNKGLTIRGAHDGHSRPGWDSPMITRLFFSALQRGRMSVDGLITHRFTPDACRDAYALVNERRGDTMGVLFDYR